jgi:N-acetyltransferase
VTPIDLQPTLRGQLLELRPLLASDWDALYAVASDPLLWAQHPAKDRHQEEVFRQFFIDALATRGALVARDLDSGRVIGSSRYHGYTAESREIEIGWSFLARSHWGGTYNGEMKQLMLAHAFTFVDRVIFCVGANNIRSQQAVQRIGAVLLDAHPAQSPETRVYGITQEAFAARSRALL